MTLNDATGKWMKTLDVISASIKFMQEFLLQELRKRGVKRDELANIEINWVITVPAIWNNAAKQFMREAAELVSGCFLMILFLIMMKSY